MKLLLDANLSWRLSKLIASNFENVYHVDKVDLRSPAKDIEIWNYALKNDLVIVTNDDDFLHLLNSKGFPPKIVLLRIGNCSTNDLAELLLRKKESLLSFEKDPLLGVLEVID